MANIDLAATYRLLLEAPDDVLDSLVESASGLVQPGDDIELIEIALQVISMWSAERKAQFISGHPRIGQVTNLSSLSAAEQASKATTPEILAKLETLNDRYERMFPGLRYITFVNGRSRAAIAEEMEERLGSVEYIHQVGSEEWNKELGRAIGDIGLIAISRSKALGRT